MAAINPTKIPPATGAKNLTPAGISRSGAEMSVERHAENEIVQFDNRSVDDRDDCPNDKAGEGRDHNQSDLVLPEPDQLSSQRQVEASPHGLEAAMRQST